MLATASPASSCTNPMVVHAANLTGAKRVAALGYGIAQSSKDCAHSAEASVEKFSDDTGQSAVYVNDSLAYGLPNGIGPEVTAMKDAGVELIAACLDLNGVKTVEQEMERQGMGDVPVFNTNGYDPGLIAEGGSLYDGDVVVASFRPFEADAGDSQLDTFREWMDKAGNEFGAVAFQGWISADLAYEGLKAAGPSFTRESVIAATNEMTDYDAGGLITPVDWSRQHEWWTEEDPVTHGYAQICYSFLRVQDGTFELAGDPSKPFSCWSPDMSSWEDPTPTDFS